MKNFLLILFLLFYISGKSVFGISSGFFVTPPFVSVEILEENEKSFDLEIGNNSDVQAMFDLSVVDFGSLDESGGVAFLSRDKYSLASWISLEKDSVIVEPKQKQKIKITILNKESLLSGGHYGAVVATIRFGEKVTKDMVGINQALSTLIYVQKTGGVNKSLVFNNLEFKNNWWKFVDNLNIRFENNGNVHLVPRGKVEIKNFFGKVVGKGVINEASAIILPESFRKFDIKVNYLQKLFWPGKYSIEISYRFDGKNDFVVTKQSVNYFGVEGIIISLIFGLFLVKILSIFRK